MKSELVLIDLLRITMTFKFIKMKFNFIKFALKKLNLLA